MVDLSHTGLNEKSKGVDTNYIGKDCLKGIVGRHLPQAAACPFALNRGIVSIAISGSPSPCQPKADVIRLST